MKYIILLIIIIGSLLSCAEKEHSEFILVENFTVPQENHPEWTDLFTENLNVISLETITSSLIGSIDKIRKFKGDYYICSSDGRYIHRFNSEGKFISSLDKQGQGPEEYQRIEDFDVYEIDGAIEVWICNNHNLKVYDAMDFSYKHQISFPFVIHKFKRIDNSRILLVTAINDYILTLTDENGEIISEYLEKEVPFLMFRPVQFISYKSFNIFQLGISNSFVAFDSNTNTYKRGYFTDRKDLLTDKQLLHSYEISGMDFLRKANELFYISNIITYNDMIWIHTRNNGKNYLTKYSNGNMISTQFSYGSIISTISIGESDDSILLYANTEQIADCKDEIFDKYRIKTDSIPDDNPYIIEFF
ncbi:6-bladed beta-propeller [Proteiniphilum saccharofermentans]|uniref:6-bladed beta-propeller n=1 Tax=Proteiniphilum saccharofermentans TaxID=1642647 RepID=UPI0028AF16E0|nr:6-bladed beta-propeller [Proteiniphilum saccharofermentans]